MYHLPELYQSKDYLVTIQERRHLEVCRDECIFPTHVCDEDVEGLCQMIIEEKGWVKPNDPFEGVTFYENLRKEVLALMHDF